MLHLCVLFDLMDRQRFHFCATHSVCEKFSPIHSLYLSNMCVCVQVVFFPTTAEKSCEVFTVVCDNCQVKDISIEGKSSQ